MNLAEREAYLKKKFVGKMCCHHSLSIGIETIGHGKDKTVNIGSKAGVFKRAVRVEMQYGPPSGWYWCARLWFVDGTFTDFSKMNEIKVKSEEP